MKLIIDSQATARLKSYQTEAKPYLLLYFDSSGCQCTVTGTPTLRFTAKVEKSYHIVEQANFCVYISDFDQMFFEDVVELKDLAYGFKLTSPSGLLNPMIPNQHLLNENEKVVKANEKI
ncbi:iron-sulfur cluster biosynthesis family protein [Amphibacillus cookii]|uniref:iron-sulfur cluster biosynthesis family protein n=1 Tax=Amphibacillus cookii TaxID=767787 RepID=UPI00195C9125|nr:iron-sulfur cluster biosynthesis family protein [Amphibacillus cookii]MBM7542465.1 uncharacterized protein YqkB [Amphibacillus cookii]